MSFNLPFRSNRLVVTALKIGSRRILSPNWTKGEECHIQLAKYFLPVGV